MDVQQLKQKIIESRRQGFSDREIRHAMRDDGVDTRKINRAFRMASNQPNKGRTNRRSERQQKNNGTVNNQGNRNRRKDTGGNRAEGSTTTAKSQRGGRVRRQNNNQRQGRATPDQDVEVLKRIDLQDDSYTVKQKFFSLRDQYKVFDNGEAIIRAKRKLFRLKEDIVFRDFEGNDIFEIKAEQIQDIAGDYTVIDSETDEPVLVLEKDFSIAQHKWEVKEPENRNTIAHIESKSALISWLRIIGGYTPALPNFMAWIPHGYNIESPEGRSMGEISGHLHIKDIYDIEIENSGEVPREAIVAAAVAVDTLEGN